MVELWDERAVACVVGKGKLGVEGKGNMGS